MDSGRTRQLWRLIHLARRLEGGMIEASVDRVNCLERRQRVVIEAILIRMDELDQTLNVPRVIVERVVRGYPWTPDASQWQSDLRRALRSRKLVEERPVLRMVMLMANAQAADLVME